MSDSLEIRRHSAAHVMAAAVKHLFPEAKFGVGPAIQDGFYYDIDIGRAFTPDDLQAVSDEMKKIVKQAQAFEREELPIDEAVKLFEKAGQTYKIELLNDLKTKGTTKMSAEESRDLDVADVSTVTIYRLGDFVDLCRGPHVSSASEIGAWKLNKIAGAYWRGKESNPQMQRLYGLCFATEKELDDYEVMLAEAEKRDHRKLGKELDLFTFSDLVGSGLPLWMPKGTILRHLLDEYVWQLRSAKGFERVAIPHLTRKSLYETSGHWAKFKDELFKIISREGHEFAVKPMNCPHHTQIFDAHLRSYREMPQRYAETTMVYRDEQTGELSGLARVLCITQDDAHVFCRKNQIEEECYAIWDIIDEFYSTFGFELSVRLSTHDPENFERYLGTQEVWLEAESNLRAMVEKRGVTFEEGRGEAAMYGPKIDFMGKDAIGRKHQVATIQLDFNMPERFGLTCINEAGEREGVVMIHCAIMGSIERFLAVLIEHYAGAFPLWLAPVQIRVLPVADRHIEFADKLSLELQAENFRVEVDRDAESVGKKIRLAEQAKVPVMLVVGDKEAEGGSLTVRRYGQKDQTTIEKKDLIDNLNQEIRDKK
ncbi:MAG: threonine--tRNA ligase [Patescibacteria group bacterium]